MATVLVDTNVVSFLFRGHHRAQDFLPYLAGYDLALSFQTIAELYEWAENNRWGAARRQRLQALLQSYYTIIPVDEELCQAWARIRAACRRMGRALAVSDAWIAATAQLYQLPLVTDDADFSGLPGLIVLPDTKQQTP